MTVMVVGCINSADGSSRTFGEETRGYEPSRSTCASRQRVQEAKFRSHDEHLVCAKKQKASSIRTCFRTYKTGENRWLSSIDCVPLPVL